MNTSQLRIVGSILLFAVIFVCGYWLSRAGKPYSVVVLAVHKLVSVAALVFLVVTLIQANKAAALSAAELTAGIVAGLFFISLVVTGGLLSTEKEMPAIVLSLHQITPYLTVLSTAVSLYLLWKRE
jgi:heme A synthase